MDENPRVFYIRTAEPFTQVVYAKNENGERTGVLDEIEREAHHPIATVMAVYDEEPYDPEHPAFASVDATQNGIVPGSPIEVIRFAVATCAGDPFDRMLGKLYAARRLVDARWHPEKGRGNAAAYFVLPSDDTGNIYFSDILRAIIEAKEHPRSSVVMFPTKVRQWARYWLDLFESAPFEDSEL